MLDTLKNRRWLALGGLLLAGAAWSSPWDIDMIDSRGFRAFEWKMRPQIPEGTIQRPSGGIPRAQANGAYQNDHIAAVDRNSADIAAVTNPYAVDDAELARGAKLFQVSCAPCHGIDGKGGGPVTHNDAAKGILRFPVPAPMLSGEGSVSGLRNDGYMYATIRHGGSIMPKYGVSLTDRERWAIVAYIRTLEGGAYVPPAPPAGTPPADAAPTGGTSG